MLLLVVMAMLSVMTPVTTSDWRDDWGDDDNNNNTSHQSVNDTNERTRDGVWEKMVRGAWLDYVDTVNRERELYGVLVEPLQVETVMEGEIYLTQSVLQYQVTRGTRERMQLT